MTMQYVSLLRRPRRKEGGLPQPVLTAWKCWIFYCKIDCKFVYISDTIYKNKQCKITNYCNACALLSSFINLHVVEHKWLLRKLTFICRFCNSAEAPNHYTQLFSTKSLSMNLPERLRVLAHLRPRMVA